MGKNVTRFGAALLFVVGLTRIAAGAELGIITGGEKGTYYQFGLNLQALVKPRDIALTVYPSKGSIENIYAVYQRPGVQLGIVQSDVLAFVARVQSDPVLQRIAKKTKMVFPLYNEEIHVLARPGVENFEDLADKRVAIGRDGSGTYLTARLLFNVAEVAPREMVPIDTDEALAELKAGRIDAMFYVAGYPVKLFAEAVTRPTTSPWSRSSTRASPSSIRAPRSRPGSTRGNPSRCRRSPSRPCSSPSTSSGATATPSDSSPRPSPTTWDGS